MIGAAPSPFGNVRKLTIMWAIIVAGIWVLAWVVGNFGTPDRRCVTWAQPCPAFTVPRTPVETLSTWDGTHYEAIARDGYSAHGPEAQNLAFFPLLPFAARFL